MIVKCEKCDALYDDTYRWTFCPHDRFDMATRVLRADGRERICRSINELNELLKGEV